MVTLAGLASATLVTTEVHADSAYASTGSSVLKFDSMRSLDTTIDTGFLGAGFASVRALIKIDPVKDGGPLYSVDMPKGAVVEASWAGDKKIVLKTANGSQTDGTVTVRHTLTPSLEVRLGVLGLNVEYAFSANDLLNQLPGASFDYDSKGRQTFAPWGFAAVDTKLNAPSLAGSTLFEQPLEGLVDRNTLEGTLGVRATTRPTFQYRTTRVTLSGAKSPITTLAGEAVIDAVDGDFIETTAQVEGEMSVSGSMEIQPFLTLTKVFQTGLTSDVPFDVVSKPYATPNASVTYPSTVVHIPLPNVHAPTKGLDLGDVTAGGSSKVSSVFVENSGEMAATMTFASSDPQFKVPAGSVTVPPKGKYELKISFAPNSDTAARADIKVISNDPDSPEQTFQIGANGALVEKSDGPAPVAAESGCGCKTAGTTTSKGTASTAFLFALGLAFVGAARRRRPTS